MTTPLDLKLSLDSGDYVAGANQALSATSLLQTGLAGVSREQSTLQQAMRLVSPFRAFSVASGAATTQAAAQQQRLSQLAAAQAVTGQSAGALTGQMNALARAFPLGQKGAEQLVQSVSRAGAASNVSVQRIGAISNEFAKLGEATGESAEAVGSSMLKLQRAYGNSSLRVDKIKQADDVLVSLSKSSGASASSILDFSNSIAPFTRQAGIGSTAVLGISSAFAKMGDDGFTATNAISKVINDLNKAVRDGGSGLDDYATIVGKTRKEFTELYKANPVQTLSTVVDALGKPGPEGARNLERLGIDSVRGQRVLTSLAQQGGISGAVQSALVAQGSDATGKAAEAATATLQSSLEKLGTAADQAGVAMSHSLLGPLTILTDVAGKFASVMAVIAQGNLGPLSLGGVGTVAGIGLGAMGTVRSLARVRAVATSRGSRAVLAGLRQGRGVSGAGFGDPDAEVSDALLNDTLKYQTTRNKRTGQLEFVLDNNGERKESTAGKFATRLGKLARGVGTNLPALDEDFRDADVGRALRNVPGALRRGVTNVAFGGSVMYEAYKNAQSEALKIGNQRDFMTRTNPLDPIQGGPTSRLVSTIKDNFTGRARAPEDASGADRIKAATTGLGQAFSDSRQSLRDWRKELDESRTPLRRFVSSTTIGVRAAARAGVGMTASGLRQAYEAVPGSSFVQRSKNLAVGTASLGRSLLTNVLSPQALLLGGAGLAIDRVMATRTASRDDLTALKESSPTEALDKYRESLGLAASSTTNLAEAMRTAAIDVAKTVTTITSAKKVTDEDVGAAMNRKRVNTYSGTDEQIGRLLSTQGLGSDPQALTAAKLDLTNQFGKARAQKILDQVQGSTTATPTPGTLGDAQANQIIADTIAQQVAGGQFDKGASKGQLDQAVRNRRGMRNLTGAVQDTYNTYLAPFGLPDYVNEVDPAKKTVEGGIQNIGARYTQQRSQYGENYAQQERLQSVNQLASAAVKQGDQVVLRRLSRQLSAVIDPTAGDNGIALSAEDITKAGGFVQGLAKKDDKFAPLLQSILASGVTLDPNQQGLLPQLTPDGQANAARRSGSNLADYLDNTKTSVVGAAIKDAVDNQGDQAKFQHAVDQLAEAARQASGNLLDAATSAGKLANALPEDSVAGQVARTARNTLDNQAISEVGPNQGSGVVLAARATIAARTLAALPQTDQQSAEYKQAKADLDQANADYHGFLVQRLTQFREFGIQQQRTQDAQTLQLSNAQQDFHQGQVYAEKDYHKSLHRENDAYGLQQLMATHDFNRQRLLQLQDFNRQEKRQVEDSAKTLLDPYQRLSAQPVWDTRSLVGNLREQLNAVNLQLSNLRLARRKGISQAVIDMLGLSSPDKAQQLAQVVADTANDPALVQQLNSGAGTRKGATGALLGESVEQRRAREDFARQRAQELQQRQTDLARGAQSLKITLGQQEQDFQEATNRGQVAQDLAMSRARAANALQLKYAQQDLERSQQEITSNNEVLEKSLTDAMHGRQVKWGDLMVNTIKQTTKKMTEVINDYRKQFQPYLADIPLLAQINDTASATQTPDQAHQTAVGNKLDRLANRGGPTGGETVPYDPPVGDAPVTSPFGPRRAPKAGATSFHPGIDFGVPVGTPVHAAMDGTVSSEGVVGGYGNLLTIDHGAGRETRYGHLSAFEIPSGARVRAGDVVALSGNTGNSTGPHLHFETRQDGQALNPVDEIPLWTHNPVSRASMPGGQSVNDLTPQMREAIALLGITPEAFLADLNGTSGGATGPAPTSVAGNVALGKRMAKAFSWDNGPEWDSLYWLWNQESGWQTTAGRPDAAYGIPQADPGTKMASYGPDWMNSASTQIRYGLDYIKGRYGDPNAAVQHKHQTDSNLGSHAAYAQPGGWYASGGIVSGAKVIGVGEAGPEAVIPLNHNGVAVLAEAMTRFIGDSEARMMSTAGARTHITYHSESHTYDQRVVVEHAQVVSGDPDDMARKLEAKARRSNLVAGPRSSR